MDQDQNPPEEPAEAAEPPFVEQISAEQVEFGPGFAGQINATQVKMQEAGALVIKAEQDVEVAFGGALAIAAGRDIKVNSGGMLACVAGRDLQLSDGISAVSTVGGRMEMKDSLGLMVELSSAQQPAQQSEDDSQSCSKGRRLGG